MRKLFLALLFTAFAACMSAQDGFSTFAVDSFVSVTFPGNVIKRDTIISNTPILSYSAIEGSSSFIIQKLPIDKGNYAVGSLPYNEEGLNNLYKAIAKGFFKKADKIDLKNGGGAPVSIGVYKGYAAAMIYEGRTAGKDMFFILGNFLYIVSYIDLEGGFNPGLSKDIFDSIVIKPNSPAQFSDENAPGFKLGEKIGELLALPLLMGLVVLIVFLVKRSREKKVVRGQ